jgi:excinuclease ABC subunit C
MNEKIISYQYPENLKQYIKQMPNSAGVYKMLDKCKNVLYVGKAKVLPKRVANYLNFTALSIRLQLMVKQIDVVETISTKSETQALLLEASLIKHLKPKYNILLKDDKSFPYIAISKDNEFNKVTKYRGDKDAKMEYFGPFAKVKNVDDTISLLQKLFLLRSCSDHYFKTRTRPCMLYQIKRCSAPCVGKISTEKYQESIQQAKNFLNGKSNLLQQDLSKLMLQASEKMDYEMAAIYRDRIGGLNNIQSKQAFYNLKILNTDVIATYQEMGECCIEVFFFRHGQSYGNKSFFPTNIEDDSANLAAFLLQFYQDHPIPEQILISVSLAHLSTIKDALNTLAQKTIKLTMAKTADQLQLIELVYNNAREAVKLKINTKAKYQQQLNALEGIFTSSKAIKRIEIYDNSHIMGTNALGAMVVFTQVGFDKSQYRKYDMKDFNGDDYAMMEHMLSRRLTRLVKEHPIYEEGIWPDLLIIDGGIGQLNAALNVLAELKLEITAISMAKGEYRNAGGEEIYQKNSPPITLSNTHASMQFLQNLRDEAHRYAITSHRNKRDKNLIHSRLDEIPSIGKKRKIALLEYFGSINAIAKATIEELEAVRMISKAMAGEIYRFFSTPPQR